MNKLQSLIYKKSNGTTSSTEQQTQPTLEVLDQLLLPNETKYIPITDIQTTYRVIKDMNVRGAPLIAIVAILGLVVDLYNSTSQKELDAIVQMNSNTGSTSTAATNAILSYILGKLDYIGTSRPTAVNMFNAINEIKTKLQTAAKTASTSNEVTSNNIKTLLLSTLSDYADFMLQRDVDDNMAIGMNGAKYILSNNNVKSNNKVTIMTICNTGSLATAGYGTALGVVRALIELNSLQQIIALETRPYNQGSRLTSYEMIVENMPNSTLICDSMAAAAIIKYNVSAIIVGADRICANGDTANKIGTYQLSIIAAELNIPFYVAAPLTTIDVTLESGLQIPIEERPATELLQSSNAPSSITVWNPAFDVTPAKYITGGIITEKGLIVPTTNGTLNVLQFVQQHTTSTTATTTSIENNSKKDIVEKKEGTTTTTSKLVIPDGYMEHILQTLPKFVFNEIPDAKELLQVSSSDEIECIEMGDGNLNLVFIVSSIKSNKKIIIKQALPYVRCVGESWPMSIDRSYFEYMALTEQKKYCPKHVPDLYYFSKSLAIIAMEYLKPPIQILRKGLLQGIKYTTMATNIGVFCGTTLFNTSGFVLDGTTLRTNVEFWSKNKEMCTLTESVVFTEPYMVHSNNNWTTPQLDNEKKTIENDIQLKLCVNQLKIKFITLTQSLIHADLHTGSVMCGVNDNETYVIDPEFAFYGPMGYDIGCFIANLLLSYVAHPGHTEQQSNDYNEWILQQIIICWNTFVTTFTNLWSNDNTHTGFAYERTMLQQFDTSIHKLFFDELLHDTIGFAGIEMIRRIVGIAHVEDISSITNTEIKVQCEKHGLAIGTILVKQNTTLSSIEQLIDLVKTITI